MRDQTEVRVKSTSISPPTSWNRVFHPTDFSEGSAVAFHHALRIASMEKGRLTVLHTHEDRESRHWNEFPRVRPLLENWGLIPPGTSRETVAESVLDVRKISSTGDDPVHASIEYLERHPHDLIVLATHQYSGLERLRHKSIAESVAREAGEFVLFIPQGSTGFIDGLSGIINLRSVLIPVDVKPDPQAAVEAAAAMASVLKAANVDFTVLYVGGEADAPDVRIFAREGWNWKLICSTGAVTDVILEVADSLEANVIVMATEGHNGILDAFRGSTTERIVRQASCPVLAVPARPLSKDSLQELPVFSSAD